MHRPLRGGAAIVVVMLALGAGVARAQLPFAGFHDPAFGSDGRAQLPFGAGARAAAVALGPGGTLTVAGDLRGAAGEGTLVARVDAAGGLDPAFNGAGFRLDRFGAAAADPQRAGAVTVTADGGTIVAGVAGDEVVVARYLPGGGLDGLFGAGGVVLRSLSGGAGMPAGTGLAAVAQAADGRIVVAGSVGVPAGGPYEDGEPGTRVVVGRLSARGVPDPAFGNGGFALLQLGARSARRPARSHAAALAPAPDGHIVLAGRASDTSGRDRAMLARLDATGRLDTSFGRSGRVLAQLGMASAARRASSTFEALVARADGTLVAGGGATDVAGREQALLARFRAGGAPDPGFGRGGVVRAHLDSEKSRAPRSILRALAPTLQDALFATGSSTGGGTFVARMTAGGRLDCSFGTLGFGAGFGAGPGAPGDPATDGGFAAIAQSDGKLVLAGRTRHGLLLGRILGGAAAGGQTPASRPGLLTLGARYIGRGRAIAYGVVDARCSAATIRFVASTARRGRSVATRFQRVSGAFGRQVVCARLRGLAPGATYRVRIDSRQTRGAVGGTRVLRAVTGGRRALAQEGCA